MGENGLPLGERDFDGKVYFCYSTSFNKIQRDLVRVDNHNVYG